MLKKYVINSKTKPTSKRSKGIRKETIGGKGGLEDILQAIEIAETPVVKEIEVESNFIQEAAPHQPNNKHSKKHVINSKTKPTSKRSKGSTKETIGGKSRLEDILQAIDIAETPVVKETEVEGSKIKGKGIMEKKLYFS